MIPIFKEVEAEERESLAKEIGEFSGGRKAFAAKVGEGYMTLSHRLTRGSTNRLPVCVADYFWQTLGKKAPARK